MSSGMKRRRKTDKQIYTNPLSDFQILSTVVLSSSKMPIYISAFPRKFSPERMQCSPNRPELNSIEFGKETGMCVVRASYAICSSSRPSGYPFLNPARPPNYQSMRRKPSPVQMTILMKRFAQSVPLFLNAGMYSLLIRKFQSLIRR
jgi:hypothetical protein